LLSHQYLGMTYHRTLKMTASSEHAAIPMLAAAHRIRGFVRDTALCDKPVGLYGTLPCVTNLLLPFGLQRLMLCLLVCMAVRFGAQGFCAEVMCLDLPSRHCIEFLKGHPRCEAVYA